LEVHVGACDVLLLDAAHREAARDLRAFRALASPWGAWVAVEGYDFGVGERDDGDADADGLVDMEAARAAVVEAWDAAAEAGELVPLLYVPRVPRDPKAPRPKGRMDGSLDCAAALARLLPWLPLDARPLDDADAVRVAPAAADAARRAAVAAACDAADVAGLAGLAADRTGMVGQVPPPEEPAAAAPDGRGLRFEAVLRARDGAERGPMLAVGALPPAGSGLDLRRGGKGEQGGKKRRGAAAVPAWQAQARARGWAGRAAHGGDEDADEDADENENEL
jgi:hypothetical protein